MLSSVAGVAVLCIGWWWWTRGPAPESEVRTYLISKRLDDKVVVKKCRYLDDVDSVYTWFGCAVVAGQRVRFPGTDTLPAGRSCYVFEVPRAAPRSERYDADASPIGQCLPWDSL